MQRPFTKVYKDFFRSNLLKPNEKLVYISLKMYADIENKCYPSAQRLAEDTGLSVRTVFNVLKQLEKKGVITKERRVRQDKRTSSNLYILHDVPEIWQEESNDVEGSERAEPDTLEEQETGEHDAEAEAETTERVEPKKEVTDSEQVKEQSQTQPKPKPKSKVIRDNDTVLDGESQASERYSLDEIRRMFNYNYMILDRSDLKRGTDVVDAVINILYETLNTTKRTIRIGGGDRPAGVVIAKLKQLDNNDILYVIDKFERHTGEVRNKSAYLLTMLYHAKEQMELDIINDIRRMGIV